MRNPKHLFAPRALALLILAAPAAHANKYLDEIYGNGTKPGAGDASRSSATDASRSSATWWSATITTEGYSPTPKIKSTRQRVEEKRCETAMGTVTKRIPGSALQIVPSEDKIEDILRNKPIEISRLQLADDSESNRIAQLAKIREYAKIVRDLILSREYMGTEDAQIHVQTILKNTIGKIPSGLSSIESVLDENLSALRTDDGRPEFRANTDNALAELTRVVTSYRKNGLDINFIANLFGRISNIPIVGRPFRGTDVVLRERFQTVKEAITAIDETLGDAVADMLISHEQMKEARIECRDLERYLELSMAITEELIVLMKEFVKDHVHSDDQIARFQKIVIEPLESTLGFILRNRTTALTAYHQFALLMDGNLDLIAIITNVRGTANLQIRVFGPGKIKANEQNRTLDFARDSILAVDELSKQTIEQIRRQGARIRAFPDFIIRSTAQMIDQMDILLGELEAAQQTQGVVLERLSKANSIFKVRIEEARKKTEEYDLMRALGQVTDGLAARKGDQVDRTPDVP